MGFQPGNNLGKGRPAGSSNKETKRLREAIGAIIEGNVEDFHSCLEEIRETNPGKFLDTYLKLLEFSLPRLKQVDNTIDVKDDTISSIKIEVVKGKLEE